MTNKERNVWQGLTSSQIAQLNEAQRMPHLDGMNQPDTYRAIATEFARRTVALLTSNDLRGALDSAEISIASQKLAQQLDHRRDRAAQIVLAARAQELEDPNGRLVYVPGKRRRVRLFPGDQTPAIINERKQAVAILDELRRTGGR